ncbi:flagellar biosynthesis protein FlhA [Cellulosilyticum lentocellum]|uniref:Flagellar biosynthesis protein FlhA n=1 Tax=Cellulosilyticum lentocellum (strain ATCC 49066 / DSM 5427 / NCIMB 11756 / RHM5) TaxID=642492 RepID=F2JGQ3_CELLD|nr:flagellar biosynthesis protein FlhA [Cellulosilyticum lentocellum]ADZ84145.1 flagellar biosynthesis protein FlhA [Cellulosilyticum lentocellum DSM 5427]
MKFKTGDIVLGLFVVGLIFLIIIPLPPTILDVLLIINISISTIILMSALFSKEPLDISLFPTLLLLTTLFRLGLNLSSTRMILRDGYAGEVVQAFGEFVAGGDIVIGCIMFIIITIVNMQVITKGSERVAEVTARFTLDAMPGKQMAIDADLNTGFIDEAEAKKRRKKIQDEAAFFGSMDGAAKFVKNDAVVGIFITFVNVIGGMIIGVAMGGLEFSDALQKFTIVTIGDGLVSAIPSLLISTATGILVTKTSTEQEMSTTLTKQLLSSPLVLMIVGITITILGLFTPMGIVVTLPIAAVWFFIASRLNKQQKIAEVESEIDTEDEAAEEIRKPENVISLLHVDPIELEFGYGIIPLADVHQGGDLLDRVVMIRRQIALELGSIVPIVRLRDNIQLAPNAYSIKIKGVEVAKGEILFDHYMAMNPGYVEEEIDGIATTEPAFGLPALWITEMQREKAEVKGYTVVDCPSIIATHLTEVIKRHLHELLSRQDVQTLINNVAETHPTLISELTPKLLSVGDIQKVLGNLLKEGISIRDLVTICEVLADYATSVRDTDVLTEYVRQGLARAISRKLFTLPTNQVITLDPTVEQQIMSSVQHTEQGAYVALDPKVVQNLMNQLKREVNKLTSVGLQPIILTSPIVRIYFKHLTEQYMPDLIVISYNEIEQDVEIQSIGMVSIA